MTRGDDPAAVLRAHAARNKALVDTLVKRGVDLNKSRAIEHHFWAEGHRNGVALARNLYERGFLILVIARVKTDDETRDLWNVEAEAEQSIVDAASDDTAATLIKVAEGWNCLYDGWGTRI